MKRIYYSIIILLCLSSNELIAENCRKLFANQDFEICIVITPKNEPALQENDPFNKNCSEVDFYAGYYNAISNDDAYWYEGETTTDNVVPLVKNQTYRVQVSVSVAPSSVTYTFLHKLNLQWYEAGFGGFTTQGFIDMEWDYTANATGIASHTFEWTPTENTLSPNGLDWAFKGLRINLFASSVDGGFDSNESLSAIIPFITTGPKKDEFPVLQRSVTPSVPSLVLHDPPGDESFSSMAANVEHCQTVSWSTQKTNEIGAWAKIKVGAKVSNSFLGLAEIETEVFASATGTFKMSLNNNTSGETERCLRTTSTFKTSSDNNAISGERGDVFIGQALEMSMGIAENISFNCGAPIINKELVIVPSAVNSEFAYTESFIKNTLIPELQETIATTNSGSNAHKTALRQLDVWEQALATNDALKNKPPLKTISFSANAEKNEEESVQTTEINSIETTLELDMNIAIEAGIEIAGNGVSAGGNIRLRSESGGGLSNSNSTTNTISYTLKDGDQVINGPGSDNFTVGIIHDGKHGTPAFVLLDGETSCPYEGGYRIDQPSFKFGDGSQNFMANGEIGETIIVPVQICNESKYARNYRLKLSTGSNTNGLLINVGGTILNSTDEGHFFGSVPAEGCVETNLIINAPTEALVDFPNIELYLYACSEDTTQDGALVSSSGFLTVNFSEAAAPFNNSCQAIALPTDGSIQGPFNNTGASAEMDEFVIAPAGSGCETNDGWCEEDVEIQNSVWFNFVAPASGEVAVSTCGLADFDTQIAVYASSNCSDFGSYTLIGANDDGPLDCATDYDSYLELIALNPGETYLVLVDGYTGAMGEFSISVSTLESSTSTSELTNVPSVRVYPNPASHSFSIDSDEAFEQLQLFSSTGQLILEINDPSKISHHKSITLPTLQNGLYVGILKTKNQNHNFKLSIVNQ